MSTTHLAQAPAETLLPEEFEQGWLGDFLSETPAWAISLCVHLAILITLASFSYVVSQEADVVLTTSVDEQIVQDEYKFDSTVVDEIGSDSDANILGPSMAAAQHTGTDNHRERERRMEEAALRPEIPILETLPTPNEAQLATTFDAVGSTEHPGGTEGAIDRLTMEIASSLRERRTLVVWLFDESLSQEKRRNQIADRFENVYKQLGLLNVGAENALKTAVAGFGRDTHILTDEPVDDVKELVAKVRSIKPDESGLENVFAAVDTVFKKFKSWRRKKGQVHNVMIVVVTDERGDDYDKLEYVIRNLSRNSMRVYCVGNAAVFGREKGYVRHTWTYENEEFTEDLPVDQGPETVAPERLRLPFWTGNRWNLEQMSSSYGPYALTRLCAETGGLFLVAEDSLGRNFDSGIMRNYGPDYRPINLYQRQLAANFAKAALVETARRTHVEDIPRPQLAFQANNDNILRQQITEAQKPLADLEYHLRAMHTMLTQGEKHREKLDSPRWRASFDLAMGRVLAMLVRAHGYNAVLADMKSNPKTFENPKNNQWRLRPAEQILGGAGVRRLHKQAIEYLTRVVDEHPGTPWALLAEVELSDPMGWQWIEAHIQLASNNRGGNNNNNNPQFAPEEEQRRRMQRQRAQKKAASRPKL